MSWYYVVGSEQKGPVSEEDLDALHRKGIVSGATLVWSEGMANWKSYTEARNLASPVTPSPTVSGMVTCAISGRQVSTEAAIPIEGTWVSAEFKEQALQRIREGIPLASTHRYGGFWIRFVAVFIDGIILNICSMVIVFILGLVLGVAGIEATSLKTIMVVLNILVGFVIAASYEIILIGRNGATVGKMACGLKVTDPHGKPIGYGKSTGRYFAKMLSSIILGIGYIMAAFDDEKRALHDRLCETRVIKK